MTAKRARVYPWLIALTMWSIVAIDFSGTGVRDRLGKVKGTDFLQFYVAGARVAEGRPDLLYDFSSQYERMQSIAGGNSDIVYLPVQAPQAAIAFAPLARFSYQGALAIWLALSGIAFAFACWLAWHQTPAWRGYRLEAAGCCAAFPAFYETVLHGQTSAVSVLLVVIALVALQRQHRFAAGLAFGCLAFKPHWVAAAGAVFLVAREWRLVAGMTLSAAAQVSVAWAVLGSRVIADYWRMMWSIQRLGDLLEPRPGHTMRGLISTIVPWPRAVLALYAAAAAVILVVVARLWRRDVPLELRFCAAVLAIVLISPHAFEYDLLVLMPVFFIVGAWIRTLPTAAERWRLTMAMIALFFAPVLALLPAVARLQFSVTAMAIVLAFIYRRGARDRGYCVATAVWPAISSSRRMSALNELCDASK